MAKLPIVTWGNPVLKQKAKDITEVTDSIRQLVADMFDAMHCENGVGLAANQVGRLERVFIVEIPQKDAKPEQYVLLNPVIKSRSKAKESQEEGCLSFPGIYGPVERPLEIEIEGYDLDWNVVNIKATDLLARALQHEFDHLDGIVFVERMNMIHRTMLSRQLRDLAKQTKASLSGHPTSKL